MKRTRSNCKLCPLSDRNRVWSEEGHGSKLMLLGEAPGQDEDLQKKPFVGASGRLLGWALKEVGLFRGSLWVTNVLCCRPPKNDLDTLEGDDGLLCCKPGLLEELEQAAQSGVTTVLALGKTATQALGISGPIEKVRGSVYPYKTLSGKTLYVIPTFHPAGIMRQHWKRSGGGTADAGVLWLADFRKARQLVDHGWKTLKEDFNIKPTLSQALAFIGDCIDNNRLVAIDTETTGLNPDYAQIVVIGLATGPETAMSIPLLDLHGQMYWTTEEWTTLKPALNKLFTTCDQLYQNCFFDVPMLRRHGFTVPSEKILHDTIMLHHTLASETKHDLGTIVSLYGSTSYWKAEFLNRTTTILEMDQLAMRTYNLRDCVVLHQVLVSMLDDLRELKLDTFYREEVQPLMACVLEMVETGIGFNPRAQIKFKTKLEQDTHALEDHLKQDLSLPGCFNLDSDDHLRWLLYGWEPNLFRRLSELPLKKPGTKVYQQLVELQAIKDRGQAYILKGWRPPQTDSGKPSVDKQGLLAFQIQLNNRRSEIVGKETFVDELGQIDLLLGWLKDLAHYGRLKKYLSTYTQYVPGKDGRIHPRWLMHGTVSGRLSCREPNLQNVPKGRDDPDDPAAQVRHFFVPREGWSFVSCDYVNLEAQLLAYETLDPQLVSVFTKGLNLHDLNTKSMFKIDETSPRWKSARRAAKVFFFGGISYGGGDRTIFEKVWLEAPELNLTFAEFKKAKDSWMADHPSYVRWKEAIGQEVMTKRELRTEFGRFRAFLSNDVDIIKEALDFKIQSSGASLVNRAMVRIAHERDRLGLKAKFVLQVHDQLVMECPDEEVQTVQGLMVSEMEKPFSYKGQTRTIKVDPTIGKTFGEL